MSTHNITACDVCKQDLVEGNRRFRVRVAIHGLNGEIKSDGTGDMVDCCSSKCVLDLVNDLVRKVS